MRKDPTGLQRWGEADRVGLGRFVKRGMSGMNNGHKKPNLLDNDRLLRILVFMEKGYMWEWKGIKLQGWSRVRHSPKRTINLCDK